MHYTILFLSEIVHRTRETIDKQHKQKNKNWFALRARVPPINNKMQLIGNLLRVCARACMVGSTRCSTPAKGSQPARSGEQNASSTAGCILWRGIYYNVLVIGWNNRVWFAGWIVELNKKYLFILAKDSIYFSISLDCSETFSDISLIKRPIKKMWNNTT